MNLELLDERETAWGFPTVRMFRLPVVGDLIELPHGDVVRAIYVNDGEVHFAVVDDDGMVDDHVNRGHLRMSATCDGLYLHIDGGENDGYSCAIVSDDGCDSCGRNHTHWRVRRGQTGES
jgi:hypothetical protein